MRQYSKAIHHITEEESDSETRWYEIPCLLQLFFFSSSTQTIFKCNKILSSTQKLQVGKNEPGRNRAYNSVSKMYIQSC